MVARAYPLAAAQKLRAQEVDAAQAALRLAREEQDAAQRLLHVQEQALVAHDALRQDAQNAARAGGVDPMELARISDYRRRLREERTQHVARVEEASSALALRSEAVDQAMAALAAARAEAEAVERHHAKWLLEQKKVRERREEAEADDGVSARFGRGE